MNRTISASVGRGSVNHNSRKFHAKNVDAERSCQNIEYVNEDIRQVYHELFDEALARYNQKQSRKDREIPDYYEKIRSSKQEKPFHEIILQIGNKDDMGAETAEGRIAAEILDQYMKNFQRRNPTLRVFSAHLHMDEATPHLHIDFVPYVSGSKRGLDTRVSLKKALAELGFSGGSRSENELNQWIASEKEQLAALMQEKGIEWEQKGTHEKHLSVLDFKKKERDKEVKALEEKKDILINETQSIREQKDALQEGIREAAAELDDLHVEIEDATEEADKVKQRRIKEEKKWEKLTANLSDVKNYATQFSRQPDEWLPKPAPFESAKSFRGRVIPVLAKLTDVVLRLYAKCIDYKQKNERLESRNTDLTERIERVSERLKDSEQENQILKEQAQDLERVKNAIGRGYVEAAIAISKQREEQKVKINHELRKKDTKYR